VQHSQFRTAAFCSIGKTSGRHRHDVRSQVDWFPSEICAQSDPPLRNAPVSTDFRLKAFGTEFLPERGIFPKPLIFRLLGGTFRHALQCRHNMPLGLRRIRALHPIAEGPGMFASRATFCTTCRFRDIVV